MSTLAEHQRVAVTESLPSPLFHSFSDFLLDPVLPHPLELDVTYDLITAGTSPTNGRFEGHVCGVRETLSRFGDIVGGAFRVRKYRVEEWIVPLQYILVPLYELIVVLFHSRGNVNRSFCVIGGRSGALGGSHRGSKSCGPSNMYTWSRAVQDQSELTHSGSSPNPYLLAP